MTYSDLSLVNLYYCHVIMCNLTKYGEYGDSDIKPNLGTAVHDWL